MENMFQTKIQGKSMDKEKVFSTNSTRITVQMYEKKTLTPSSHHAPRDGSRPEPKAKTLKALEEKLKEHLYDLVQKKIFQGTRKVLTTKY